jgi:hypothetical protein
MDRKAIATGVAALGLALAGCGPAAAPMTRAEFVKQATVICRHRLVRYRAATAQAHGDYRRAMTAAVPALEASVDKLAALRPPTALRSAFAEVLAFERHQVDVAHETLSTGRAPADATEHGAPLHRHEQMRAEMGMGDCNY